MARRKPTTGQWAIEGCPEHKRVQLSYGQWHDWADEQERNGLRQKLCPKCKLWLYPQEFSEEDTRD